LININGKYQIKQEDHIIYEDHNLITFYGLIYFLNRCVNEEYSTIKYIALGNSNVPPSKNNIQLGNEIIRKTCTTDVDLEEYKIVLNTSFEAKDIVGVSEIGVFTNELLISQDTFQEITGDMLINPVGSVEIEYTYSITTSTSRTNWKPITGKSIYWIYEPDTVVGVNEENTGNGYRKTNSMEELETINGSYYYNSTVKNLYVNPLTTDINTVDLLITTKK
jgi:hypothetical protein